jgi:hypothetical protein
MVVVDFAVVFAMRVCRVADVCGVPGAGAVVARRPLLHAFFSATHGYGYGQTRLRGCV